MGLKLQYGWFVHMGTRRLGLGKERTLDQREDLSVRFKKSSGPHITQPAKLARLSGSIPQNKGAE